MKIPSCCQCKPKKKKGKNKKRSKNTKIVTCNMTHAAFITYLKRR